MRSVKAAKVKTVGGWEGNIVQSGGTMIALSKTCSLLTKGPENWVAGDIGVDALLQRLGRGLVAWHVAHVREKSARPGQIGMGAFVERT